MNHTESSDSMKNSFRWPTILPLSLLAPLCVGVCLRLFLGWDLNVNQESDFLGNLRSAIAAGGGDFTSMLFVGPRSLALGAGLLLTGGNGYRELLLANTLFLYPLSALSIWLLSRQALKATCSICFVQLLFAIWPPYVFSSFLAATENILPLAMCLPLWGVVRAINKRTVASATLAGLTMGVSLLVKPNLLMLTPVFPLAFLLSTTPDPPFWGVRHELKKGFILVSTYLLTTVLTITPWQVYSYKGLGFFEIISPFGSHMLSCVNTPYGKRQYEIGSDFATNLMPEFKINETLKEQTAAQKKYAVEYIKHWPTFFVAQLPENFAFLCMTVNEMALWVHSNLPGGLAGYGTPYKQLDQAVIFLGLSLGVGGFACFANRHGLAALRLMRLVLVTGFVSTLVLLLGNIRHRMAYEPYLFIFGACWLECFGAGVLKGVTAPVYGVAFLAGRFARAARWFWLLAWRRRIVVALMIVALAAAWHMARRNTLQASPEDLIGGTVARIDGDFMATPHRSIGLLSPGKGAWHAEFAVSAHSAGNYIMNATYASAGSYPLDVYINGEQQLSGVFGESFGGATNAFARTRRIGTVRLREGLNILKLVQDGNWTLPLAAPLAEIQLHAQPGVADAPPDKANLEWRSLDQTGKFELRSNKVDYPIRAKTDCLLRVLADKRGNVELQLTYTLYPADGTNRSPEKHSSKISALLQGVHFKPDFDVAGIELALTATGTGQVLADTTVRLEAGTSRDLLDRPGRLFKGPYIERIEFTPAL